MKLKTILLTFALLFVCAIPAFAAEQSYPAFIPDNDYIVVQDGVGNYYALAFNADRYGDIKTYHAIGGSSQYPQQFFVFTTLDNQNYPTISYYNYDNGWNLSDEVNTNGSQPTVYLSLSCPAWKDVAFTIIDSNVDIYDYHSGEKVFPLTPPLAEVVAESLGNFQVDLVGMMKTLALCGVGLTALLVGLKVFGRVLPIFRV